MQKIKAIGSLILMSALLISVTGITVSRHYCMGTLITESFYQSSVCCGDVGDDTNCHKEKKPSKSDCCSDVYFSVPGIKVLNHSSKIFAQEQLISPPQIPGWTQPTELVILNEFITFSNAPPLFLEKDILIEVQRFLI